MSIQQFLPDKLDALYGAMVGGGVAMLVNFFTNRNSRKMLSLQLTHQATQREKDRQLTLKREIYIPLLEAASDAISFYGQIGTVPSELIRRPEPLNSLARHVAKMSGIASPEVIEAVYIAQKQLVIGAVKLFNERIPIEVVINQLSSVDSMIKSYEAKSESFNQRFEKHIDAGTGDGGLKDVLMRLTKEHLEVVEKLHQQKSELVLKKSTLEMDISRQATEDMKIIGPQNRAALVAIRKDLGLPIDANWLNNLSDAHSKDVFKAVEKFHQNVEKIIADAKSQIPINKLASGVHHE
jgi:hypothetical protein